MRWKYFNKLKITQVDRIRAWSLCPFHKDTETANLSITISGDYEGRYKCWACGVSGGLKNAQLNQIKEQTPVKTQRAKDTTPEIVNWDKYINQCVTYLKYNPLFKLQLANELDITPSLLDRWGIGFNGEAFVIPMMHPYSYKWGYCGAQLRHFNGKKRTVKGSKVGHFMERMFISNCYRLFIRVPKYQEVLCICEGFSDAIAINDLGFYSIGIYNCLAHDKIRHSVANVFWNYPVKRILIIPDNDKVGIKSGQIIKKQLKAYSFISSVTNTFDYKGAKDIREYIKLNGKENTKQEILEQAWEQ